MRVALRCRPAQTMMPIPARAYEYFYNLEYDKAIHEFELAQAAHPDDPFAVNHLQAAVVFKELYRIGALDTEAYAADNFLTKKLAAPLDPAVANRVKQLTDQSWRSPRRSSTRTPTTSTLFMPAVRPRHECDLRRSGHPRLVRGPPQRGGGAARQRTRAGTRPQVHRCQGVGRNRPVHRGIVELAGESSGLGCGP